MDDTRYQPHCTCGWVSPLTYADQREAGQIATIHFTIRHIKDTYNEDYQISVTPIEG